MKPKCGRMVGFSSGGENPHGVKAVTSGQRCAVALWFTLDPLFREMVNIFCNERAFTAMLAGEHVEMQTLCGLKGICFIHIYQSVFLVQKPD